MRLGSLFAGIGGFDLAARWMGWTTAWFSEIDPYASAVLAKRWPGVPNHGDITQIDFTKVEPIDMLVGGFPCQDISNAGKRAGISGERSGLWSEYARAIGQLRPRYVVVENVAALLGRGVERVLGDLAALGYDAEWQVLSAADVGAPHLRERLWIVAYPNGNARERRAVQGAYGKGRQRAATEPAVVRQDGQLGADDLGSSSEVVADAGLDGCLRGGVKEHGDQQGAPGHQSDGRRARGRRDGSEELADAEGQRYNAGARDSRTRPAEERGPEESQRFGEAVANPEGFTERARLRSDESAGKRGRRSSDRSGAGDVPESHGGGRPVCRAAASDSESPGVAHPAQLHEAIPDAQRERFEGIQPRRTAAATTDGSSDGGDPGWWATEPDVGRVAHGVPARVDRLTCLGNSLVPRCAFAIFQEIEARHSVCPSAEKTE